MNTIKNILIYIIIAAALINIAAVNTQKFNRRTNKAFINAQKLEQNNKQDLALTEYLKILKKYPNSVQTLERIAYIYITQNKEEDAKNYAKQAIHTGEPCPISFNIMGTVYENNNKLSMAESYYSKAIKANASYAAAYNNLGNIYLKKGDINPAFDYYSKAIELDKNNPLFYTNLGFIEELKGNTESARQKYNKAIELDKNFTLAKDNLRRLENRLNPPPLTPEEKQIAASICKMNLSGEFKLITAFKSYDGTRTALYDYKGRQQFIIKLLSDKNNFNETIFSQMILEHKGELETLLKTLTESNNLSIVGQGYIPTKQRAILYVTAAYQKNNIPFEGIFCIISKRNINKHVIVSIIANKGFYQRTPSEIFIKDIVKNL